MSDTLKKYLSADRSTRVQTLKLSDAWQTGLAHQDLPPAITSLLGQLTAASILLAGNIKFDGSVVLQIQGNGPVNLIMVECTSDMNIRATAHINDRHLITPGINLQELMNNDGQGKFSVMLEPDNKRDRSKAYQGIVPLESDSVAQALEFYMQHSEQLDTRLWLAADENQCGGLLLQRLPAETEDALHTWEHLQTLANTIKPIELIEKDSTTLIHQLFWQDDLIAFPEQHVHWHCPCTRERVASMLQTLGKQEVNEILQEQGHIEVDCNFCGKVYKFDELDCVAIFAQASSQLNVPGSNLIH